MKLPTPTLGTVNRDAERPQAGDGSRREDGLSVGDEHPFLGRKLATEKVFSERTAWLIDQEIEKLIDLAENSAIEALEANREILDTLAQNLFDEETLDKARLEEFFRGGVNLTLSTELVLP